MIYISTAFIKVETLDRRNEIKNILTANGRRKFNVNPDSNKYIILNSLSGGRPVWMTSSVPHTNPDFIDCNFYANGDEDLAVKLFLELAQMDNENTDTLWYFAETITTNKDGGDVRSDKVYFKGLSLYAKCNPTTQPLTTFKFAEAVRDGKIKL